MNPESLIFDIDGTLWDSRALVAEGYNRQLKAEGKTQYCTDAETLKSLFGKIMTEIADALFPDLCGKEKYDLMARCMKTENEYLHRNPCRIGYPEVRETLETLAQSHRLFIVSNSQKGYPELCTEKLGIEHLISAHLCFGDTGTSKGQTILRLMRDQNISSAAYIGDTQGDCDAADEAGIPFIWAAYGFGKVSHYDRKLSAFRDLPELLNQAPAAGKETVNL